jgi:hypothetical protein
MSVELWKSIFDWATVVFIACTVFTGAGALITGDILTKRQAKELREFQLKIEAEQRETAKAQAKAFEAQLALRKAAEYAATPRRIILGNRNGDQEIREARFKELGKYSATQAVIVYVQDEEAQILAFDVRAALLKSGWKSVSVVNLASTPIPLGFIEEGIQVRTMLPMNPSDISIPPSGAAPPPVVNALIALLNLDLGPPTGSPFGVRWEPDGFIHGKHPAGLIRYGFKIPENGVVITVGRKPTEQAFWGIPDLPTPEKK